MQDKSPEIMKHCKKKSYKTFVRRLKNWPKNFGRDNDRCSYLFDAVCIHRSIVF